MMRSHYKIRKTYFPRTPLQQLLAFTASAVVISSLAILHFENQSDHADFDGEGYNLLLNSGFELTDGADGAAYWQAFGAKQGSESSSATRDLTIHHTGRCSIRVDQRAKGIDAESGIVQKLEKIPLSSTLKLTAQIKSTGDSPAFVRVYFLPSAGVKAIAINDSPSVTKSRSFEQIEADIPVPVDAGACYVALVTRGNGTAWFDNIRLTTNNQWDPKPPPERVLSLKEFTNGSFESTSGNFPTSWSAPGFDTGVSASVIEDGRTGKAVELKMDKAGLASRAWSQVFRVTGKPGSDVSVSVWINATNPQKSGVALRLMDERLRAMATHSAVADPAIKGQWQQATVTVTIPLQCKFAELELFLSAPGTVIFDDVVVAFE